MLAWAFWGVHAQVLSDIVQRAGLGDGQQVAMDLQIGAYVDDAGACDRIQKTCIPQSYTRHTSRELTVPCEGMNSLCMNAALCSLLSRQDSVS